MMQKLSQMLQKGCFCYIYDNYGLLLSICAMKKHGVTSKKEGKSLLLVFLMINLLFRHLRYQSFPPSVFWVIRAFGAYLQLWPLSFRLLG